MKIIGILIVLLGVLYLTYMVGGDQIGIKKGDSAQRNLTHMEAAEQGAKTATDAINRSLNQGEAPK